MSSAKNIAGSSKDGSRTPATDTDVSPTDSRHPLRRVESISEEHDFPASFQSTDTMRRVDPQNYGQYFGVTCARVVRLTDVDQEPYHHNRTHRRTSDVANHLSIANARYHILQIHHVL
jgi:hypothetical protein